MADIFNQSGAPSRLPEGMGPVVPVLARRGQFKPVVGQGLNVTLLGEIVRCEVTEVLSDDALVVKVISIVVDKSGHGYRSGSLIACQRKWNGLSETWEPISDREVREQEQIEAAKRMVVQAQQPPNVVSSTDIVPRVTTGPAIETEALPRKVLGPRRSKVGRKS